MQTHLSPPSIVTKQKKNSRHNSSLNGGDDQKTILEENSAERLAKTSNHIETGQIEHRHASELFETDSSGQISPDEENEILVGDDDQDEQIDSSSASDNIFDDEDAQGIDIVVGSPIKARSGDA